STDKNDLGVKLICLVCLCVYDLHPLGFFRVLVVQDTGHDRKRSQRQVAGLHRCRKCSRLCTEICPKVTPQPTLVLELTVDPAFVRYSNVGRPGMDEVPGTAVLLFEAGGQVFFDYVHWDGRHKLAVRKHVQTIPISLYTGKPLGITIPRSNILVPDGPVRTVAILQVGLKVYIRKTVALSSPGQGAPSYLIPPVPVKPLDLRIGALFFVYPEILVFLV